MAFLPQPQIFSPFFRLIDEVERSISQPQSRGAFSSCVPAVNIAPTPTFSPRVNVSEEQTQYLLQAEVPGYEQKDVEIEWADVSTLTISGRQQQHTESVENDKTPAAVEAAPASPTLSAHQASVEDTVDEDTPNRDEWVDLPSVETESTTTAAAPTPATTVSQPATPAISQPQTKYWVKERIVGQFSRSFQFPNRVDHENVKASLKNGVLSVVVPKAKVPEKRRIVVE